MQLIQILKKKKTKELNLNIMWKKIIKKKNIVKQMENKIAYNDSLKNINECNFQNYNKIIRELIKAKDILSQKK